jgi:glycosyltransferase involved in cell wall biosynthesis
VLPYRSATSSANALLAYEHRVPVIATNVGDMAEQVRDGESGLLCAPADPAALAEALRRLHPPPSCVAKQVSRPIRNREAPVAEAHLV